MFLLSIITVTFLADHMSPGGGYGHIVIVLNTPRKDLINLLGTTFRTACS
jgi:hypothetical protein